MTFLERRVSRLERIIRPAAEPLRIVRQIVAPGHLDAPVVRADCLGESFSRCADESEEQFLARVFDELVVLQPGEVLPRVLLFSDKGGVHAG